MSPGDVWQMMPADCKPAMILIQRGGLMDEAREFILARAEVILRRLSKVTMMDHAHAIEAAAAEWLEARI